MDYLVKNLAYLEAEAQRRQESQGSIGRRAGIGQTALSKIISGRTKEPGYKTVAGLAAAFGVSIDELVHRDIEKDGVLPRLESQPARLSEEILDAALDCLQKMRRQPNFDLGTGTDAGALVAAYHAIMDGADEYEAVAAVLNYAVRQGGGYGHGIALQQEEIGRRSR